jgi:hypothetical protein
MTFSVGLWGIATAWEAWVLSWNPRPSSFPSWPGSPGLEGRGDITNIIFQPWGFLSQISGFPSQIQPFPQILGFVEALSLSLSQILLSAA